MSFGDKLARLLMRAFALPVADATALQAVAAADRADGMLRTKLDDATLWQFAAGSSAGASSTVIVPDAGTGRWLKSAIGSAMASATLALTTSGNGADLVGLYDSASDITATTAGGAIRELAVIKVRKASLTVLHSDLVAAATSEAVNFASALPSNAYILGHTLILNTAFSGGGAGSVTVDLGGTDTDAIVDGADVFTGAATPKAGTAGINPTGKFGGQTLVATFTADVNTADLTAGSLTIDAIYACIA